MHLHPFFLCIISNKEQGMLNIEVVRFNHNSKFLVPCSVFKYTLLIIFCFSSFSFGWYSIELYFCSPSNKGQVK